MIIYLIKFILCSGVLLLVYLLFFEKEKMHRFNRFYLLIGIAFSFLVPFINIKAKEEVVPFAKSAYLVINNSSSSYIDNSSTAITIEKKNSGSDILVLLYGVVTTIFLSRFLKNRFSLYIKIKREKKVPFEEAKIVLCHSLPFPYSFLNFIFLNKKAYETNNIEKEVLHHEMAHVRQKHSLDILFAELILCFCWFNPFLFMYKKAIRLNHEFLADTQVIKTFRDTKSYQHLLLNQASAASYSFLTSSFNYLTTKKRLIMMTKTTSPLTVLLKQVCLLPVTALLVFFFGTKVIAQNVEATKNSVVSEQKNQKDTTTPKALLGMSIGYTKEGASEGLIKEYQNIINKYKKSDSFNWKDFQNISQEDRSRMETIFKQMNVKQQNEQLIGFLKNLPPLPQVVPTREQFNSFKNANVYGVWIDEKKVLNTELNKYENTNFSQVFVSKLYGAAKKGRNYSYQVDMMTNNYYADYYEKKNAVKNESIMVAVYRTPKGLGMYNIK